MTPEAEIANLLYAYAEYMDRGDFASAAGLFADARLRLGPDTEVDADTMLSMWRAMVIVYPDGTPRTKHVVTNPIIEVDDEVGTATCRWGHLPLAGDYYTVLQQTDDFPLQVIVTGRYDDRFERVDGRWRFCHRAYSLIDQVGDLSHHLSQVLG